MKKKVLMVLLAATLSVSMIAGCGSKSDNNTDTTKTESKQDSDQEAADKVAKLIDDIYVQERTDKTDEQCTAAKEAWDALTDAQKELVEGENLNMAEHHECSFARFDSVASCLHVVGITAMASHDGEGIQTMYGGDV